jgi:Subtilase family/Carboxypeptidase regulatory-like domain
MVATSSFTATVEDSGATPVTGAAVTVTLVDSRRRIRLTAVAPGQYAVRELTPGEYDVRLSKRGYLTDTYRIQLSPGANSRGFVIGRRGERFYLAAGLRIYFQPVEDRVLLAVYGAEAGRRLEDAAAARSMFMQVPSPVEGREPGDSVMRAVSVQPGAATRTPFTPDVAALRDDLEAEGLNVIPALVIQRGAAPPQGLTQELLVQFAPDVSEERVRAIAAEAGLEVRRPVLSTPNAYLLRDPDGPSYELLDTAQRLVEDQPVITAEPEILMLLEEDQFTPNDPLYNLQTHLPLIDADDAWEALGEFLGQAHRGGSPEICIAVFDPGGVAPDHPDLTANLSGGVGKLVVAFNFRAMAAQTVAGLGSDHGTQCAGTATAAFDDNRGVSGVAANCRLIGARLPNPNTGVMMADAFLWAAGIDNGNTTPGFPPLPTQPADVISNSWGVRNAALSTALQNAFDRLTDDGRDGRGCVVTFSTGNLGYVQFSNVRRFAAYARNLAVGASINANPTSPVNSSQPDPNGNTNNLVALVDTRAFYNPFGPEMDIVAPSHTCYDRATGNLVDPTTSTVRVGNGALDGCPGAAMCLDYATNFGGTSHASPTVAGTAALILSVFPLLAWDEARAVLQRTAVRIDATQGNPIGQYVDNDGDGTAEFSQWYGYGRVNVAEAIREATKLAVAAFQAWS